MSIKGWGLHFSGKRTWHFHGRDHGSRRQRNDAEMLKAAGLGVAMENASKEIKDISDVVTLTNEECGVAHAIETYILNAE